jgi:Glycosyl transferase family 2
VRDSLRGALPDLRLTLDAPLPAELVVGRGSAVFVCGTCLEPIASPMLVVDGSEQPLMAHGMPRIDVLHAGGAYRSGFWGMARLPPRPGRAPRVIGLRARLLDGRAVEAELGRIEVVDAPAPLPGAPEVAICMATYEPPVELLRRQIESIRAQTLRDWVCVISDDCSSPAAYAELEALTTGDERFVLTRSPSRLGFYRNFERALALAPAGARYVAMADQDDVWHPDKLATLVAEVGDARLVYSDARVIAPDGAVVSNTYWTARRNNHDDVGALLITNAVTGAASLFPRSLLEDALPFPPAQFLHFHDHWIALCARATGRIRYVDRPLYDYVQHGTAYVGHAQANRMPGLVERLGQLRRGPRDRLRLWRMHYFGDACRLLQWATVLELRCGERLRPAARRALERFRRADHSLAPLARFAWLGAREVLGLRRETLGGEWLMLHAFGWRHLIAANASDRPHGLLRLDAVPPGARDPTPEAHAPGAVELRALAAKVAPLRVAVRPDAPRRVNVLVPTIDLEHLFGGYIAKFNLARRLAERGARVRIVTVDPTGPLPDGWRRRVESYAGLRGLFDAVELTFGREADALELSPEDAFVATTWWTAHVAHAARRELGRERFVYLIQEHEPFTFPAGSYAALAAASYRLPHVALFSSELLREYSLARGIVAPESTSFQNAITAVEPAPEFGRRLLFYARPEPHAARNMFELGALALRRAAEHGALDGWAVSGIGTVGSGRRLDLGGGAALELLPRAAQRDYAELLRGHDVGLALMHTPHPSLVPIEMAAAGMLAVTNTFENKTAETLAAISPNLLAAEPTVDAIAYALCAATAAAGDVGARLRGSRVAWSRDWDESFGDELMEWVEARLG